MKWKQIKIKSLFISQISTYLCCGVIISVFRMDWRSFNKILILCVNSLELASITGSKRSKGSIPRVVWVPRLWPPDGAVHLQVAPHQNGEGHPVDEHEKDDVAQTDGVASLEGQADSKLPVVGDPKQGHRGHQYGEGPTCSHDVSRMFQRKPKHNCFHILTVVKRIYFCSGCLCDLPECVWSKLRWVQLEVIILHNSRTHLDIPFRLFWSITCTLSSSLSF